MTTFYLDPVDGNDASAGTSFATRWQTITSGATAARIAPGDTIRVIKSPDPTSLGQSATWTDGSRTVTLTSAVTATVTAATAAWTTVTNTTSTTSTDRKLGSTSSSLSVAAAFVAGKSHYTTVSQADYSAYQQITFWIKQTSGTLASADGEILLSLCSDTAGATPVNTFFIPRIKSLNAWQAFTIDAGSNLGSSIQSVAFYIGTDQGAQTFLINNIQAVKSSSAADSLSLTSLISKNSGTEGWFAIDSISGTSVVLRTASVAYSLSTAGTPATYAGTTATVTTYKREPLNLPSANVAASNNATTFGQIQDNGTAGSPITFSGGWDSTSMSTQTGDTYISGVNGLGWGLYFTAKSYVTTDKINLVNFYNGLFLSGACSNINVTAKEMSFHTLTNVLVQNTGAATVGPVNCTITIDNVNCCGSTGGTGINLFRVAKNCKFTVVNCNSNWLNGIWFQGDSGTSNPYTTSKIALNVTTVRRNSNIGATFQSAIGCNLAFGTIGNNLSNQLRFEVLSGGANPYPGAVENKVTVTSAITGGGQTGVALLGAINNTFVFTGATISGCTSGMSFARPNAGNVVIGGTFSSNTTEDIGVDAGLLTCVNTTLNSTTKYNLWEPGYSRINFQNFGGVANDHRQVFDFGTITSDTTTRHTASGISWKISPTSTSYVTSDFPMVLPVGKVAVNASALVTAKVWVYRSNTGITTNLVCRGGQIAGVSSDVTTSASGSASAWEQLTITFTPSEAGVVELEVQAYGGTTYSVYVDDLSVTQA